MREREASIGLLDSGVGGLTVAREVVKALPEEKIIYYGDTLHLPYGPRLLDEVRSFVYKIIDYLIEEKQVKAVVLACNTATSAALEIVKQKYNIPIFGTIKSVARHAFEVSKKNKIGVIGTVGTINSQAYQRALHNLDQELEIFSAACPEFVSLVEKGIFRGKKAEKVAHKYLEGLKNAGIDALILGCTHYPYLIPVIQKVMGNKVTLISSGEAMALEIRKTLEEKGLLNQNCNTSLNQQEFIVSDKNKISRTFLKKGRKYLNLPSLEFKEHNIFD
ncbi:MAG: glutamate racemase [Bacillota bacterium]